MLSADASLHWCRASVMDWIPMLHPFMMILTACLFSSSPVIILTPVVIQENVETMTPGSFSGWQEHFGDFCFQFFMSGAVFLDHACDSGVCYVVLDLLHALDSHFTSDTAFFQQFLCAVIHSGSSCHMAETDDSGANGYL